jgi:hypothetical protein
MFNTSTSTVFIEKINDMISKAVWNGDVKNKKSFIPFILSTPALMGKKLSIILNFLDKYKLRDHFNNWLDDATMNDIRDVIIDNQPAAFISMMWRDAETENIEQLFKKYEKNIRSLEEKLNGSYDLYYYISFLLEHGRIPSNQIYDKFFNKKDNSFNHHAYKLLVDIIKKNESGSEIPIDERLIQAVAKSSLYSYDLVKFVKAGIPSWNDKKGSLDKTPVNYKVPDIIKQKASEYKEEVEDSSFYESTNLLEERKYDELRSELVKSLEGKNITYNIKGVLNLPQLQTSGTIIADNVREINLPHLQKSGFIYAFNAIKINLPQLKKSNHINARNAREINLPQLQTIGGIDAFKATEINLPQLQKTEEIDARSAKKIIIPKHLVDKLMNVPEDSEIIHPE